MSSTKSRQDTRAVVSLVARYRSPATFEYVQEACCDVSAGGMFIKSGSPATAGTLLKLECEVADGESAKIRGVGRVVWLRNAQNEHGPAGMGVKFVKLEPGSKELILDLIKRLEAVGIEARSISAAPEHAAQAQANAVGRRGASISKPIETSPPPVRSSIPTTTNARSSAPAGSRALGGSTGAKLPHDPAAKSARGPNGFGSSVPPQPLGASEPGLATTPKPPQRSGSAPSEPSQAAAAKPIEPSSAAKSADIEAAIPAVEARANASEKTTRPAEASTRAGSAVVATATTDDASERAAIGAPAATARGGGALKVWLGIAAGVLVLLAIILADENGDSTQTANQRRPASESTQVQPAASSQSTAEAAPQHAGPENPASSDRAQADQPANPSQPSTTEAVPPTAAATTAPADEPSQPEQPAEKAAAVAEPQPSTEHAAPAAAPTEHVKPHADVASAPKPSAEAVDSHASIAANDHPAAAERSSPPPSAAGKTPRAAETYASSTAAEHSTPPASAAKAPEAAAGQFVIDFVTRPSGATVSIGDLSVVAPGPIELGKDIPDRVKVIAKKDGFQQSSAWIDRAGFESVDGKMWRRVYMTLPVDPAAAAAAPTTVHPH